MHIRSYHANCLATGTSAAQQTTVLHHYRALTVTEIAATAAHRLVAAGRATLATFAVTVIELQTMLRFAG